MKIAGMWSNIKSYLFRMLEEELGTLTEPERKLVAILEIVRIEEHVCSNRVCRGRPQQKRQALARALVAKAVLDLGTTRDLIAYLGSSPSLRRICGFEFSEEIPSEATFSRAFEEFSTSQLPARVHAVLLRTHLGEHVVGHISRDATAITGRERPAPKTAVVAEEPMTQEPVVGAAAALDVMAMGPDVSVAQCPKRQRRRGRPRQDKTAPKPVAETRLERQQHQSLEEMLAELPTACDVGTKKNSKGHGQHWIGYKLHLDVADGGLVISALLTSASVHDSQVALPLARLTQTRVRHLYELMDAAYDAKIIHADCRARGHVPIIDPNPRRGHTWPLDPAQKARFRERSTVERVNGRLKEEFGAARVHVRGAAKVLTHLMFGILALTADQLLKLVQ